MTKRGVFDGLPARVADALKAGPLPDIRLATLVRRSALVIGPVTAGLALARRAMDGSWEGVPLVLLIAALAFVALPLLLVRRHRAIAAAGASIPLIAVVSLAAMLWIERGLDSDATYWLALVPLVGAFFAGARMAAALALLGSAALIVAFARTPVALDAKHWLELMAAVSAVFFSGLFGVLYESGRRRAERELAEEKRESDALIAALPDSLMRVSAAGDVIDVRLALSSDGWAPLEAEERVDKLSNLLDEELASALQNQVRKTLEQRTVTHATASFGGPAARPCEVRMAPLDDATAVVVVRDLTNERRAERVTQAFVDAVGHELRTPLTAIGGALGLMGSTSKANELISIARRNTERLTGLIADLLDVKKLEQRSRLPQLQDLPLDALVGRVLTARGRPAHVELSLEEGLVVQGHARYLERAMGELLDNAVKFSPTGSRVEVVGRKSGEKVRLMVRDDGPGIPESYQPAVFERFSASDTSTRRAAGMGLGLYLTKRYIAAMGGEISFTSSAGEGTTFVIELAAESQGDGVADATLVA